MADNEKISSQEKNKITDLEGEITRLKSAVEELTVLNEIAVAASRTLEVENLLDMIVQKSIKAIKAEQGTIMLVTEQEINPLKTLIRQEVFSQVRPTYKVGTHISGWVLQNRQPLIITDLANDLRFHTTEKEREEIHSVLCVPIWCKGKIIGVFILTNKKYNEKFNNEDMRLLSIIAAQSGQLIRNSQLQMEAIEKKRLEHELELARKIQMGLIPKKEPDIPELDVASYFNPTDAVGGDYYDYLKLDDDKFGIVVADVSGHGPSAAMMMTMVKGIIHSILHSFKSPEQALKSIDLIFNQIAPKEVFVTMVLMIFDLKNKILKFSNAGHNPLLYYNSDSKSCDVVKLKGCALNLSKLSIFATQEILLNQNDRFLIYTDGVTDAFNNNDELFELERLVQSFNKTTDNSASKIIETVKTDLLAFTGNCKQRDDIAMIAIKIS